MMLRVGSQSPENLRGLEISAVARRKVHGHEYRKPRAITERSGFQESQATWKFPKGRHCITHRRSMDKLLLGAAISLLYRKRSNCREVQGHTDQIPDLNAEEILLCRSSSSIHTAKTLLVPRVTMSEWMPGSVWDVHW